MLGERESKRKTQTFLLPQPFWPLPDTSKHQLCAVWNVVRFPPSRATCAWFTGLLDSRAPVQPCLLSSSWTQLEATDHQEGFRLRGENRAGGCRDNQLHTPLMQKTTRPIGYAATGALKLLTRSISSCPIPILIKVIYSRVNILALLLASTHCWEEYLTLLCLTTLAACGLLCPPAVKRVFRAFSLKAAACCIR